MNESNLQQTKTTRLRNTNGLLMTKVSKPKLKLPSVLGVGGRLELMVKSTLVVRYGSKPLEFAKDRNAIELASEAEVADTLRKVHEAVELGELDALFEQQAQFGRRVTLKNK